LLSMKPDVVLAPNDEIVPLVDLIEARNEALKGRLILRLNASKPKAAAYMQVARTPKDLPVVCAAVSRFADGAYGIALGGYGGHPIRVQTAEDALAEGADKETVRAAVIEAYQAADDQWASGAYRGEVAGVLVSRLVEEVGR
jgi:CO/xanthine dehydrogenase FAD-binding subunit